MSPLLSSSEGVGAGVAGPAFVSGTTISVVEEEDVDSEDVEENVEEDDVEVVGTGAVVLTVPVSLNGGKLVVAPVARVDTISPPSSRKVPLPS